MAKFEKEAANLGRRLRSFIDMQKPIVCQYANVESVDKDAMTMEVSVGSSVIIKDVSLVSVLGGSGSLLSIPAVGSLVVLGFINGVTSLPFPLVFTELDSVTLKHDLESEEDVIFTDKQQFFVKRGASSLKIENDLISLNDGTLDGLVVVGKLTQRLNDLQSQIDQIQASISAHTHTVTTTGSSSSQSGGTTSTSYSKVTLTPVKNEDYENIKIKQ